MESLSKSLDLPTLTPAIGLFGPALIWFFHLVAVSIIAEWGYVAGWNDWRFIGVTLIAWLILLVCLVAVSASAWAVYRVFRVQQNLRLKESNGEALANNGNAFIARVGFFSGVIFLLITVTQSVPIVYFVSQP